MVWGNSTRCLMFWRLLVDWVSFTFASRAFFWHDFDLVSTWFCCMTLTFVWPQDDMDQLETQKLSMSYNKCNNYQTLVILLGTLLCFRSEIYSSNLGRNSSRILHLILCGWSNNYFCFETYQGFGCLHPHFSQLIFQQSHYLLIVLFHTSCCMLCLLCQMDFTS